MIVIVRHGAREDDVPNRKRKSEVSYDPALSGLGEEQSRITGQYIAETFLSHHIHYNSKNITIISSPFLRTLQTAVIIANKLTRTKVQVWDPLCEELRKDLFAYFPLPSLAFFTFTAYLPQNVTKYFTSIHINIFKYTCFIL